MKTSIRLGLTSLAVSCITLAAASTPLPFLESAQPAHAPQAILLAPDGLDGQGLAPSRQDSRAALSSSTRQ